MKASADFLPFFFFLVVLSDASARAEITYRQASIRHELSDNTNRLECNQHPPHATHHAQRVLLISGMDILAPSPRAYLAQGRQ